MKVAGIDVGSITSKAVILNDHDIYFSSQKITESWQIEAENILNKVLKKANLKREDLDFVMSTGLVGEDWEGCDDWLSDVSASANAAINYLPSARTIIDIGAETSRVNICDEMAIIIDYKANQKCASGTGLFLDLIAEALEVKVEEIGDISLKATKKIAMNSNCAVFAESEVISLVHNGEKVEDILKSVLDMIAARTAGLARSLKFDKNKDVVFIGGPAKNVGLGNAISEALGVKVWVPDHPEIMNAFGAALEAKELV